MTDIPPELQDVSSERMAWAILDHLVRTMPVEERLGEMTNEELARLVLDYVWAYIPVDTVFSMVISEVIDRLDPNLSKDETP